MTTYRPWHWLRVYRASPGAALSDASVGFVTGLVFWPVALGHSSLAGVPPDVAVGNSIFPAISYVLSGSMPLLSLSSGSGAALCVKEVVDNAEDLDLTPSELVCLLAAFVGTLHLLMGLLNFVFIADVFSQPLLRGRTAAAVLLVMISQARVLTGISLTRSNGLPYEKFIATVTSLEAAEKHTCALSVGLLILILSLRQLGKCSALKLSQHRSASAQANVDRDASLGVVPNSIGQPCPSEQTQFMRSSSSTYAGVRYNCVRSCVTLVAHALSTLRNLCALVVGCIVVHVLGDHHIDLVDHMPAPSFGLHLPKISIARIVALAPASALIAFIIFGSHVLVAERMRKPSDRWNPKQELLALGSGGLTSAMAGGMPVMVNLGVCQSLHSCRGGFATIFNSLGHLAAFFLVAKVEAFQKIPRCAVATILVGEFAPLLLEVPRDVRHLFRQSYTNRRFACGSDLGIYVAALVCPLVFGIINGSLLAIVMELLLAMMRFAGAGYTYIGRIPGSRTYDELGVEGSDAIALPKISIVRLTAPRWFGNVASTTRTARLERAASGREVYCVVVDMRMVSFLDETAMVHYKREWAGDRGYKIIITNTCALVRRQIKDCGLADILRQSDETLRDLHAAVSWAEQYVKDLEEHQVRVGVRVRCPQVSTGCD